MPVTLAAIDPETHDESGARILRPPNAWLLFRSHHVQTATRGSEDPPPGSTEKISEDSKSASEKWGSMSLEEKAPWFELYAERKREHKEKYPLYKFKRQSKPVHNAANVDVLEKDGRELVDAPVSEPLKDETVSDASCGGPPISVVEGNIESECDSEDSDSSASESSSESSSGVNDPLGTASSQPPLTPFLLESSLKRSLSFYDSDPISSPHARFKVQSSRFKKGL